MRNRVRPLVLCSLMPACWILVGTAPTQAATTVVAQWTQKHPDLSFHGIGGLKRTGEEPPAWAAAVGVSDQHIQNGRLKWRVDWAITAEDDSWSKEKIIGLSDLNNINDVDLLRYGWYFVGNAVVAWFNGNPLEGCATQDDFSENEIWEIRVNGPVIRWLRGGSTICTKTDNDRPLFLRANAMFAHQNAWIDNVEITDANALGLRVMEVIPAHTATGVPRTTDVTVTFSKPVDPIWVNNATFIVSGGGVGDPGPSVMGVITTAQDRLSATFNPAGLLSGNTIYTVTVTTGVKDPDGHDLDQDDDYENGNQDFTSSFSTGWWPLRWQVWLAFAIFLPLAWFLFRSYQKRNARPNQGMQPSR